MSKWLPHLPARVPKRGNAITRAIGRLILRVAGWRVTGEIPDLPRMIWAVAPHTSNWDWVLAMLGVFALGVRANYLVKHTVFFWPLGALLRVTGGIPVNRNAPAGMVEDVAQRIAGVPEIVLAITPEGTRSRVEQWKTGFLRIAERARLPVVLVSWDYARREIRFGPLAELSDDHAMDIERIRAYYRQFVGRNPENQSP
jgi:1-acyl-sn-glycerol-3-phosphate acyltransferase